VDLFIVGNSASMFLFVSREQLAEARDAVMNDNVVRLRVRVMLLVPFHFQEALASRMVT
jgi:hypothetical protein